MLCESCVLCNLPWLLFWSPCSRLQCVCVCVCVCVCLRRRQASTCTSPLAISYTTGLSYNNTPTSTPMYACMHVPMLHIHVEHTSCTPAGTQQWALCTTRHCIHGDTMMIHAPFNTRTPQGTAATRVTNHTIMWCVSKTLTRCKTRHHVLGKSFMPQRIVHHLLGTIPCKCCQL